MLPRLNLFCPMTERFLHTCRFVAKSFYKNCNVISNCTKAKKDTLYLVWTKDSHIKDFPGVNKPEKLPFFSTGLSNTEITHWNFSRFCLRPFNQKPKHQIFFFYVLRFDVCVLSAECLSGGGGVCGFPLSQYIRRQSWFCGRNARMSACLVSSEHK